MIYIDELLVKIIHTQREALIFGVREKDVRTLTSLANSVKSEVFITKNQSNLIVKLLEQYKDNFIDLKDELTDALGDPQWSRSFRVIEQMRKLYIDHKFSDSPVITVEFTFSTNLRKVLTQASKTLQGLIQDTNGKVYHTELTEHNIVTLVELLRPLAFDIDETIINHYNVIKSWDKEEVKKSYRFDAITTRNYETCIAKDIVDFDTVSDDIKQDRSLRYRYFSGQSLADNGTLTRKISTRNKNRIWINSDDYSFDDLFTSLKELNRLPMLVVFDSFNQTKLSDVMESLSASMKNVGIDDNVGVYFRLPNTDVGTKFNKIVNENQYNKYLSTDTKVVCVQSNKIPKFLLTTPWAPMSVVVIETNLRSSKTAVYANGCDLIISYSKDEPLYEKSDIWA